MKRVLPAEAILYFGDTARCPYGDKTPQQVLEYSLEVCDFLVSQGVKMLVVACNTATAAALPALQARYSVPVVGVVGPGARAAAMATQSSRIGVIGTQVTIASGVYEHAVHALIPAAQVYSLACPEFVPLVERGETSGAAVEEIVRNRLQPLKSLEIDTLVLGCTHYPHLQGVIQHVMGDGVRLISSADETAREVKSALEATGQSAGVRTAVPDRYFTSGDPLWMERALRRWLMDDTAVGSAARIDLNQVTVR